MDCTNVIIIQGKVEMINQMKPQRKKVQTYLLKENYLLPVDIDIKQHQQLQQVSLDKIPEIERNINIIKEYLSKKGDFLWILLWRQKTDNSDNEEQIIPGWTGFHHEVTNASEELMHDIHYLPARNDSPTKYDTIQEILTQVKAKAEAFSLTCIDLLLDHAIYAKALEVLQNLNNADLKNFINLIMGGFHACGFFLTVIGKKFGSAGLYDLIVEARLSGLESVNQILNIKEYNYVIRICKVIFEPLQRAKLDVFEEWLNKEKKSDILINLLESEVFAELIKKRESTTFNTCLESISALLDTYDEFEIKIRNGDFGSMAMFW